MEDGSGTWASGPKWSPEKAPCSWLLLGPADNLLVIWRVKQEMEDLYLPLAVALFETNKQTKKKKERASKRKKERL